MVHSGDDALLVTDLINIRYLTGFTGSNAALLVLASDDESGAPETIVDTGSEKPRSDPRTLFCTDGRYTTQSAQEVPDLPRLISRPCDLALLRRAPEGVIGFEAISVTVAAHGAMAVIVEENPAAIELVPTVGVVEGLRAVKDDAEISALRQACGRGSGTRRTDRGRWHPGGPNRAGSGPGPGSADAGTGRQ